MYKIELFDTALGFAAAAPLRGDISLRQDYLTLEPTELTCAALPAEQGQLARVTNGAQVVLEGVVADVQPGAGMTTLSVRPLQALFDRPVWCPADGIADCAAWLEETLRAYFVSPEDTLQALPIRLSRTASGGYLSTDGASSTALADVLSAALLTYRIAVDCRLDLTARVLQVDIRTVTQQLTLEADRPNILQREITLGDAGGQANKAFVRDPQTGAQTVWYLHPDGSVTQTDADRITPVRWVLLEEANAAQAAAQALSQQQADNEITLLVRRDDRLIDPLHCELGAQVTVLSGGRAYRSILTGRELQPDTVRLLFGAVRVELTAQLLVQKRRKQ